MNDIDILDAWNRPTSQCNRAKVLDFARRIVALAKTKVRAEAGGVEWGVIRQVRTSPLETTLRRTGGVEE